ncbi:MAG: T9SS type A sorting domain-containing protein [Bacteroidia bacterium]|nr:T9SS type A sorting domain-containing protein [Bacteroidia bacterium]
MNHNATCVFRYLPFIACLMFGLTFVPGTAHAQFRSVTSGDWNNPLTWGSLAGLPGPSDAVQILAGHTVTVTPGSPGCNQCRTLTVGRSVGNAALVFASGSALTVADSVTIGGGSTGEVGIISFANGGTLITPQILPGNSGAAQWVAGTGTVQFTGTCNVVMSSDLFNSFHHVIIDKSNGTVSVDRDILVSGNWTVNSAFDPQTFTVTFNGSSTQTIAGSIPATFNSLVNSGAGLTLAQDVSLSGDWTNHAPVSPATRSVSFVGGTFQQIGGSLTPQFHHLVNDKTGSALVVNVSLSLTGNLTNNWALSFTSGTVAFNGSTNQTIGGSSPLTLPAVTLDKPGGTLTLADHSTTITGLLTLSNGKFLIGDNNVTVGQIAGSGGSAASYICTDGNGMLTRSVNTTDVLFPIGTLSGYNPVKINNAGTRDVFSARVREGLTNALPNNAYVNREWNITEAVPGGSNAQLTFQWNTADELSGFGRSLGLSVFHYASGWSQTSATFTDLGSGVYSATAGGCSSFSPFTVGNPGALPVELTSFTARYVNEEVRLQWSTATELNNYGFTVERSTDGTVWQDVAFVHGAGNSNSPKRYSVTDGARDLPRKGEVAYRLRQIDRDGTTEHSKTVYVRLGAAPTSMTLYPAYPNPFNPSTTLSFSLPESATLSVRVFNTYGQLVAALHEATQMDAGFHTLDVNGAGLPSGVYFVCFETADRTLQQRIVLSK